MLVIVVGTSSSSGSSSGNGSGSAGGDSSGAGGGGGSGASVFTLVCSQGWTSGVGIHYIIVGFVFRVLGYYSDYYYIYHARFV